MKIAIYSRKSKFTGKGESIENQVVLCREYIQRNIPDAKDSEILVYEDEGFSAKNLDRPQFRMMMQSARKQPFDYIVVYRLDRISRNVGDFATLIEELNGMRTVRDILTNPVYCTADEAAFDYFTKHGLMPFHRTEQNGKKQLRLPPEEWIISLGKHKPLIPSEEWIKTKLSTSVEKNLHHPCSNRLRSFSKAFFSMREM